MKNGIVREEVRWRVQWVDWVTICQHFYHKCSQFIDESIAASSSYEVSNDCLSRLEYLHWIEMHAFTHCPLYNKVGDFQYVLAMSARLQ